MMVLQLLLLVVVVLVIFEGKLIHTMITQSSGSSGVRTVESEAVTEKAETPETGQGQTPAGQTSSGNRTGDSGNGTVLAGFASSGSSSADTPEVSESETQEVTEPPTETETAAPYGTVQPSEIIDSSAVVPEQAEPVDDSYFSDAVFIGDSRMEGFRNSSGITQGTFLTSVGMSISKFSTTTFTTTDGTVTAYQELSGRQYAKIYFMLGTNDLGYYPWDEFKADIENILKQMHKLQRSAIIYICSCIYVEEDKAEFDYVNNENVQKLNGYLVEACEDLDYCYFINLNEVLSDGYHELIPGASADGVHLYEKYYQLMLDYLKTHYLPLDNSSVLDLSRAAEETTES